MLCPKCNALLHEGDKFCHACGYNIAETFSGEAPGRSSSFSDKRSTEYSFSEVNTEEVPVRPKKRNFFQRMLYVLIKPPAEWGVIATEKPRVLKILFGYLLVLGIVAFIAFFLGDVLYLLKYHVNYTVIHLITVFNIFKVLGMLVSPLIAAIIINALCPAFQIGKNFGRVFQLAAYSFTPVILSWTLYIIPVVIFVHLAHLLGLYGIIIYLTGFKKLLSIPAGKQIGFFFASVAILYGVYYCLYCTIGFVFTNLSEYSNIAKIIF